MKEIESVLANYLGSVSTLVGGKPQRRKVVGGSPLPVDVVIEKDLRSFFENALTDQGRDLSDYKVYGSVGQPNRYVAKIPWLATLHRSITTSTTHGYYIVLLFREDMTGCALSLNQGFTHFQRAFGTDELAHRKVKEAGQVAASYLPVPSGFVVGEIDLVATGEMGTGYEDGAIVSKLYFDGQGISENQLRQDFGTLLGLYDTLRQKFGPDLIPAAPPALDAEFQEAAAALSLKSNEQRKPIPPGPQQPPKKTGHGPRSGYRRDPDVSAEAMRSADYLCEIDALHESFISRVTGKKFVEAHHLLPMQYQEQFTASLDVPENIVVLCPNCHRLLHHGRHKDSQIVLKSLYKKRAESLKGRGLDVDNTTLLKFYNQDIIDL